MRGWEGGFETFGGAVAGEGGLRREMELVMVVRFGFLVECTIKSPTWLEFPMLPNASTQRFYLYTYKRRLDG